MTWYIRGLELQQNENVINSLKMLTQQNNMEHHPAEIQNALSIFVLPIRDLLGIVVHIIQNFICTCNNF